jgi:hypothetical protein
MSILLTIRDEEMNGETLNEFALDFLTEQITVRELIRSRVYQEVKDHNTKPNQTNFRGLVQPTDAERTLNGYRLKQPRQIEWKAQFEKAVEAFKKSQILILVNGRQLDSLEDEIEVGPETTVTFLRLTLSVGG